MSILTVLPRSFALYFSNKCFLSEIFTLTIRYKMRKFTSYYQAMNYGRYIIEDKERVDFVKRIASTGN